MRARHSSSPLIKGAPLLQSPARRQAGAKPDGTRRSAGSRSAAAGRTKPPSATAAEGLKPLSDWTQPPAGPFEPGGPVRAPLYSVQPSLQCALSETPFQNRASSMRCPVGRCLSRRSAQAVLPQADIRVAGAIAALDCRASVRSIVARQPASVSTAQARTEIMPAKRVRSVGAARPASNFDLWRRSCHAAG